MDFYKQLFIFLTISLVNLHGWGETTEETAEVPQTLVQPPKLDVSTTTQPDKVSKSRAHVEKLLRIREQKSDSSYARRKQDVYKELLNIFKSTIAPLENLYSFQDLGFGSLSADNDISSKPIFVFLGTWSTGKSSMINYLLNLENSSSRLYTGAEPTTSEFTVLTHGDSFKSIDGKVLSSNHQFTDLEKFGGTFLEKLKGIQVPRPLLERLIIVDTPGAIENKVQQDRGYSYENVTKWFVDKASLIFLLFDPFRLNIGKELENIFSLLKGKESKIRIILNKADIVSPRELIKVYGTLLWNISPMSRRVEPPRVYVGSFWGFEPKMYSQKEALLADEESLLRDLHQVVVNSVESKISLVRSYGQKVYLHAAIVDKYLEVFNRERSIFGDNEVKWQNILDHPEEYDIFESFTRKPWSISSLDIPSPELYRQFFKINKLKKFQPLSSHCTIIWGCPTDKIKESITFTLPRLMVKYQKMSGEDTCEDHSCDNEY